MRKQCYSVSAYFENACHFDKALLTIGSKAPRNLKTNKSIEIPPLPTKVIPITFSI